MESVPEFEVNYSDEEQDPTSEEIKEFEFEFEFDNGFEHEYEHEYEKDGSFEWEFEHEFTYGSNPNRDTATVRPQNERPDYQDVTDALEPAEANIVPPIQATTVQSQVLSPTPVVDSLVDDAPVDVITEVVPVAEVPRFESTEEPPIWISPVSEEPMSPQDLAPQDLDLTPQELDLSSQDLIPQQLEQDLHLTPQDLEPTPQDLAPQDLDLAPQYPPVSGIYDATPPTEQEEPRLTEPSDVETENASRKKRCIA